MRWEGSSSLSSSLFSLADHIYTPRSCLLPGTVLSNTNATKSAKTMFSDRRALIAKSNYPPNKQTSQDSKKSIPNDKIKGKCFIEYLCNIMPDLNITI